MNRRNTILNIILLAFFLHSLGPLPLANANSLALPEPGTMVHLSKQYTPTLLKGLKIHPDNPLAFDFVLDNGDQTLSNAELEETSSKLIRYFLASLTIPDKDLWVNLSPYEKNRIVPEAFGQTEMGRDLLAQDYLLKQITASLLYPEDKIGDQFWKRMKKLAVQKFGTNEIPTNTFNKVWVIPDNAVVYENAETGTAYIVESHLKVMLEEDFLALSKGKAPTADFSVSKSTNTLGSQIIREIILPELTKEINENKHFAQLRQIYSSYILATWYKEKIKNSLLNAVYSDKNKIAGVNIDDPSEKEKIYQQYLEAFRKGAYSYIKEDYDPVTEEMIPRKYFSGGFNLSWVSSSPITIVQRIPMALNRTLASTLLGFSIISTTIAPLTQELVPLYPARTVKKEISKKEEELGTLTAGYERLEDNTPDFSILANGEASSEGFLPISATEIILDIHDPTNRANDSNFGKLDAEVPAEVAVARRDIGMIASQLGFSSDVGNVFDNELIARQIYIFFKNLESDFSEKLQEPIRISMTATNDVLYQDESHTPMPGIIFTYSTGEKKASQENTIGRFMINRKPGERTFLLSGLLSRDISDPGKKAVVTAYTANYDYDKDYTLGEIQDLVSILEQENVLGEDNLERALSRTLTENDKDIFTLLFKDKGLEFYNKILEESRSRGLSFHDTVNFLLGGETYESLGPIIKLLARAAVSLTVAQFEAIEIADKTDLASIIDAFVKHERILTPSQKYPANAAVTPALFSGAITLKDLALKYNIKLELDVAIPDGLPNIALYKRIGFKTKPTAHASKITELLQQLETIRAEYKESKKKLTLAETTHRLFQFEHFLGELVFDPQEYRQSFSFDADSKIANDILQTIKKQIPAIAANLNMPVQVVSQAYTESHLGKKLPAQKFSLMVNHPVIGGTSGETEEFEAATFSLIMDTDSLLIAHLAINNPLSQPNDKVIVTSDDADFEYQPAQSQKALTELSYLLESKLGQESLAALMKTDFGEEQYAPMVQNLIGQDKYSEILTELSDGVGPQPYFGDNLPVDNSFNGFLNEALGHRVHYPQTPLALRVIAMAAVGLTLGQFNELPISSADNMTTLINTLLSQQRPYFPSQRYPSSNALTKSFSQVAKELRTIANDNGLASINFEVDVRGAFQNLLLYITAGYSVSYPDEAPLLQQTTQYFMMNNGKMPLNELSWRIYWGGLNNGLFLGRPHVFEFKHDLQRTQDNPLKAREQLERIANATPVGAEYYQKTNRGNLVRDLRTNNTPPLEENVLKAASPVGGIDLNPENLTLFTQSNTGEIEFIVNPAILEQLKDIPGFIPVIQTIQPMANLQLFLGLTPAAN